MKWEPSDGVGHRATGPTGTLYKTIHDSSRGRWHLNATEQSAAVSHHVRRPGEPHGSPPRWWRTEAAAIKHGELLAEGLKSTRVIAGVEVHVGAHGASGWYIDAGGLVIWKRASVTLEEAQTMLAEMKPVAMRRLMQARRVENARVFERIERQDAR